MRNIKQLVLRLTKYTENNAKKLWLVFVSIVVGGAIGYVGQYIYTNYMGIWQNSQNVRDLFLALVSLIGFPLIIWRTRIADRQAKTAQEQVGLTQKQIKITEDNNLAATFTAAIGQLGALNEEKEPALELRLGAIFTLEKLAKSNREYHPQIMEILSAYVRLHASVTKSRNKSDPELSGEFVPIREDIHAVVIVIGRRDVASDKERINLRSVCLPGVILNRANLTRVNLSQSDLTRACLNGTDLSKAMLMETDLSDADLMSVNLSNANLMKANLTEAKLMKANLHEAVLIRAKFNRTALNGANLSGANVSGSDLSRAHLQRANLEGIIDVYNRSAETSDDSIELVQSEIT